LDQKAGQSLGLWNQSLVVALIPRGHSSPGGWNMAGRRFLD